jgi:hypothetical protein
MRIKANAVYLDVCALGRPYDDQDFMRIEIESTAVQLIVLCVKTGRFSLYFSNVHVREIQDNPDEIIRADLMTLLGNIGKDAGPSINPDVLEERGRSLISHGMGVADAFHVAHAEQLQAAFVTCDDRLLKKYRSIGKKVWCGTPVEFCEKEGLL